MQVYTPKQLQSAVEAGGVVNATITAQGASFYIHIQSQTGDGILTKARSREARGFTNPMQALTELRRLGIRVGGFDTTQWIPEQYETPTRPDRAQAMSELHTLAEHGRWLRERVAAAQAEAADRTTEWVGQGVIDTDSAAQRRRLEDGLGKTP